MKPVFHYLPQPFLCLLLNCAVMSPVQGRRVKLQSRKADARAIVEKEQLDAKIASEKNRLVKSNKESEEDNADLKTRVDR